MHHTAVFTRLLTAVLLLGLAVGAAAQQSEDFGDYEVHYNALNSDLLSPDVASAYGIRRAPGNILLNVTLMKKHEDGSTTAVPATVSASAVNLNGQHREIEMREVGEQDAWYYIGQMRVRNEENFNFTLEVTPADEDNADPMQVSFQQKFYTE